ncbi:hypothetical protein STEG23_014558, partial [Scotinomys teguina]
MRLWWLQHEAGNGSYSQSQNLHLELQNLSNLQHEDKIISLLSLSIFNLVTQGAKKPCMVKSEGHVERAPLFAGPGKADLASHWTLPQERRSRTSGEMAPPLSTGKGKLTLMVQNHIAKAAKFSCLLRLEQGSLVLLGDAGPHKARVPGVGAAQLLDLPLGVKLPMIPGTDTVYFTTNIGERLFQPSYGFNLSDPYCRLLETQYKSLHDPHLRTYYKRKDILRRLKKGGYITSNNKIVCSLRELNKYREYLTSLKLDFERNYIREQQMITKQLHKLQETSQFPHCSDVTRFQNWLLQDNTQSIKDQERLLRHRYLDMIRKELEHLDHIAQEQRLLRMDREERQQREYAIKKLNLRRKIEEEWKTKEMLLLSKIGEDVKREQRVEEQRRRSREESDRKKQALLEKKMAYHLQKMQDTGFKDDTEEMHLNIKDKMELLMN